MPNSPCRTRGATILLATCLALLAGCTTTGETVAASPASEERCDVVEPKKDAPSITSVLDLSAIPAAVLRGAASDTLLLQATYDSTGALRSFGAHARPGRHGVAEAATLALQPYVATTSAAPATTVRGLLVPGSSPQIAAVQLRYECRPRLLNASDISRRLEEVARDTLNRGGQATLWLKIDEEGRVTDTRVHRSSGQPTQDNSIVRVARQSRFTPALLDGYAVPVWIQIPFVIRRR